MIRPRKFSLHSIFCKLLATFLIMLAFSAVFINLKAVFAANPDTAAMSMSVTEGIDLMSNGYANMNLLYNLSNSYLADTYRKMLGTSSDTVVGESTPIPESTVQNNMTRNVRNDFYASVKEWQKTSFNFRTWITDSNMTSKGYNNECLVSLSGLVAPQILNTTIMGSDAEVTIGIGSHNDNTSEQLMQGEFEEVLFAQSLLNSLNETGTYECDWVTTFTVPTGTVILNEEALAGLSWQVDFGNGTSLSASLTVQDHSKIVLSEKTIVSDRDFITPPEELAIALHDYKSFEITILYPNTTWTGQANNGATELGDWGKTWTWGWSYDYLWNPSEKSEYGSLIVSLKAHLGFSFAFHIGWTFGGFLGIVPESFDAYIDAESKAEVSLSATATASFSESIDTVIPIFDPPINLFTFTIGPVPCWLTLHLDLIPKITFTASGTISLAASAEAHAGLKAGVHWDHGGFSGIWEPNYGATKTGPTFKSVEETLTFEPQVGIRISVLLWDLVGPDLELDVYGHADLHLANVKIMGWDFYIGIKVYAGVVIGTNWLTKLLGLAGKTWNKKLFDDKLAEWKGTIGSNPVKVTITNVNPTQLFFGSPLAIKGQVSSSAPGDRTGQVEIYYSTDPQDPTNFRLATSVTTNATGSFSTSWMPDDGGVYYFRADYDGNIHFASDESSSPYPAVNVIKLGGLGEGYFKQMNYITDPTLSRNLITSPSSDPYYSGHNPDGSYARSDHVTYDYYNSTPVDVPENGTFYIDDSYVYSWFRMGNLTTAPLPDGALQQGDPWVYWDLYDPSGNLIAHINTLNNASINQYIYNESCGWPSYEFSPTVKVSKGSGFTTAAQIPPASVNQAGPAGLGYTWPEWCCWTKIKIDPAWADQGPLRLEVHTSVADFNQTIQVVRHPTSTTLQFISFNPERQQTGIGSTLPHGTLHLTATDSTCYFGQAAILYVDTRIADTNADITGAGEYVIQYRTDPNDTWTNYTSGWFSGSYMPEFIPNETGDYYLRAIWDGQGQFEGMSGGNATSISQTIHLLVVRNPVGLALAPTGVQTVLIGSSVNITVQAYTLNTLDNGSRLFGKRITIYYGEWNTTGDIQIYYLNTGVTDSYGMYTYSWTPPEEQSFYIVFAEFYGDPYYVETNSSATNINMSPGDPTYVSIIHGANESIERLFGGSIQLQANVTDVEIMKTHLLVNTGTMEFYVNQILVGSDDDSNGDGIYAINWDPQNWTTTGAQELAAYFTGAIGYAQSGANSTIEIYRSQVDISIVNNPSSLLVLPVGTTKSWDVKFEALRGANDTYNISIAGLDPSTYVLSVTSLSLDPSGTSGPTAADVTLTVSMPGGATQLPNIPFNITAESISDPLSSDSLSCTLRETYVPVLPAALQGGLAVYISPKTGEGSATRDGSLQIRFRVTVVNGQNFDDTVTLRISVAQIQQPLQASLGWFNWTSIKIYVPMNSNFTVVLTAIIPKSIILQQGQNFTRTFTVVANSTGWPANSAVDSGMITTQGSVNDFGAFVTVTPINQTIDKPGGQASYNVEVNSTSGHGENVYVIVKGGSSLGFNWTSQTLLLGSGATWKFGLNVNYSGNSVGNIHFTVTVFTFPDVHVLGWNLALASTSGQVESNCFVDYVNVTSGALGATIPGVTLVIGEPNCTDSDSNIYVISTTPFTLILEDTSSGNTLPPCSYDFSNSSGYDSGWINYVGPFYLTNLADGAYTISYNNTDITQSQTVFLDNTPPKSTLSISDPKHHSILVNGPFYVSSDTTFTLDGIDTGSGVGLISYRIIPSGGYSHFIWTTYTVPFTLSSEGAFNIYYFSTDNLGNVENSGHITVIVDDTPPVTSLSFSAPRQIGGGSSYVSQSTIFTLHETDGASQVAFTSYDINNSRYDSGWINYVGPFNLTGLASGIYTIYYNSTDYVGNVENTRQHMVTLNSPDTTPPSTTSTITGPTALKIRTIYVSSSTLFTLSAVDNVGGSGVSITLYRISGVNYDSGWLAYNGSFSLPSMSDGTCAIYYASADNVGNIEDTQTLTVILDNTPPSTILTIGEPQIPAVGSTPLSVNSSTMFTLGATDQGCGVAFSTYRITNGSNYDSDWINYSSPFYLTGLADGAYTIFYNSTDSLNNTESTNSQVVLLDNTPPVSTLSIGFPNYVAGSTYVTSGTTFTLSAVDAGSGVGLTSYRIVSGGYDSGWLIYTIPFNLTSLNDGNCTIFYFSTDNLGNVEVTKNRKVVLDNTSPSTNLTVVGINYAGNTYVNSSAIFTLNATDAGSGVFATAYRISNGTYDSGWKTCNGNFNLASFTGLQKGGTYILSYNSTDNLGNVEPTATFAITIILHSVKVQITPASSSTNPGQVATYKINITNLGNVPDTYSLTIQLNDFGGLYKAYPTVIQTSWTSLGTASWTLNPAQTGTATFTVTIPANWGGLQDATYTFNATATCQADPTVLVNPLASLTVKASKFGGATYTDLEVQWLQNSISTSPIPQTVKNGLLSTLGVARMTLNQAQMLIRAGHTREANVMLSATQIVLDVFIFQVLMQRGRTIPPNAAQTLIQTAQKIQQELQTIKSLT